MTTMTLEQISAFAKSHKVTPTERRAQRVSLLMGLRSKNSSLTREEATSVLDQIEGHETREEKPSR
jgi:hypothetical protein